MIFSSLDVITRRTLLERSLPIHYYLEALLHASACLRECTFDSLKIINTVRLPVNQNNFSVDLPGDFTDDIGVSIPVGQFLHPVPKNNGITPLTTHDTTGQYTIYGSQQFSSEIINQSIFGFNTNWLWFWNINDYGEPTGRFYGAIGAGLQNGYKLIRERRQIQLTESFTNDTIVLKYISDGQSSDSATQIDSYAIKTIQSFIDWQMSPNKMNKDSPEGRLFYNEKRLLRARMGEITVTDIRQIILRSYQASVKN